MNFLQFLYMFFYRFWAVVKVVQRAFAPPFWFGRDQRNTKSRGMLQFLRGVVIRIPSSQWFVGSAFTKLLKQILQVRKTAGMVGDENSGGVE